MELKKILSRVIVTSTVLSMSMSIIALADVKGTVTGDSVNIRSQASATADIIKVINSGVEVTVSNKSDEWYRVSFDNVVGGYVSTDYVEMPPIQASVTSNNINIREFPSTNSKIVAAVKQWDKVNVTGITGAWYQIKRGNGDTAYIASEYVIGEDLDLVKTVNVDVPSNLVENTYALVNASSLNVRTAPSTSAESLASLPNGDVVDVIESGSEWIKIKTEDGVEGYVNTSFVTIRSGEKPSRSLASSKGQQVIDYAKQFLGTPYVWGGTNLKSGVDCSGFVYSVYKNFGISLNRSSASMASNGVPVSKNELVAGDLVLFDTTGANDGGISHVGIYMGDGQYIHSSSGKVKGVIISNLNDDYSRRTYVTARRVLR